VRRAIAALEGARDADGPGGTCEHGEDTAGWLSLAKVAAMAPSADISHRKLTYLAVIMFTLCACTDLHTVTLDHEHQKSPLALHVSLEDQA